MRFNNLPIQKKLTRLILLISSTILFITGISFFAYEYYTYKESTVEKLSTVGEIIATNSTAAIAFNSQDDAYDILSAISAEPYIKKACIYDADGNLFSFFPKTAEVKFVHETPTLPSHIFSSKGLEMYLPIQENEKQLGFLYVTYDLSEINKRLKLYALISFLVIIISLILVFFFARVLQKGISDPILSLAGTAQRISELQDYSVRVEKHSEDEVGRLTDAFNHMLTQIERQNETMKGYNNDLIQKARELELASKYKSEFLANMSHELRSPLNSLLILSNDLSQNKSGNLSDEQVESAKIIHTSGKDLLNLINDILDLSKIEAGKMDAVIENVHVAEVAQLAKKVFSPLTEKKGLRFSLEISPRVPTVIRTDELRLNQILKNLLSNAIKFTNEGEVRLRVYKEGNGICFSVVDTGIGISKEKQGLIFEAFKQADGGTARRYGGTGLGLSIATQLTGLLGGKLTLESELGSGATFTLKLPMEEDERNKNENEKVYETSFDELTKKESVESQEYIDYETIQDDRYEVSDSSKVILIIEDDKKFASILYEKSKQKGFKTLIAGTGEDGLELAEKHEPDAIILDLKLPGISGVTVLGNLKSNIKLRHIPVHIISALDKEDTPIKSNVINYLTKPVNEEQLKLTFDLIEDVINKKMKKLLIVEDEKRVRETIVLLLGDKEGIDVLEAASVSEAVKRLKENGIDCVILDLKLQDGSGVDLVKEIKGWENYKTPPIVVYTGKDLSSTEVDYIKGWAETIIKKDGESGKRLVDETALLLHREVGKMSKENQAIISEMNNPEVILDKKKVLIVDDDMRNIFALSKSLRDFGVKVTKAEGGKEGIDALQKDPNIDMVLMDIMMPEMDGYETIGRIRQNPEFEHLPIIALTAKAMAGDREKCIEAGANDYFPKPVDVNELVKLMKLWMR